MSDLVGNHIEAAQLKILDSYDNGVECIKVTQSVL